VKSTLINGEFEFKIDDKKQEIETGVALSDVWFKGRFNIPTGTHKLEWIYAKWNVEGESDDLSAEIQNITIRGVKSMN
jgi:hypothetical protein